MSFCWLKDLITYIDQSPFWAGLLSNLIVVILAGIALPSYLAWMKRPRRIEFFFLGTGTDTTTLSRNPQGRYEYYFELVVRHPGGNSLKEGLFWHLYAPTYINMRVDDLGQGTLPRHAVEGPVVKYYGKMQGPILSESTQELHYHFHGEFEMPDQLRNDEEIVLLYSFSTEFGNYPKTQRFFSKEKGIVDPNSLNQLKLKIPKEKTDSEER